jgi:hypothetical protein
VTIPETSPLFATVGTYPIDGDPWEGDPVRVDPGASRRAEGWEPDTLPAEWANFMTGVQGDWIEYGRRKRLAMALGTWTPRTPSSNFPLRAIAARDATAALVGVIPTLPTDHALAIVATAGGDTIEATSDGSAWTDTTTGLGSVLVADLAYLFSANRWIVVGGTSNGTIFSRVAGNLATSWTSVYGPTLARFTHVACSAGRAIAIGLGGRTVTSTDGVSWSASTTLLEEATDIAYGGGLFVAVYRDTIYTSPDGTAWTTRLFIAATAGTAPSRVAYDSTRDRFFVSSSASGSAKLWTFPATDPGTVTSISLGEAVNSLAVSNGVLALVSENHVRFSDDAGASFSYAYTGPTVAVGNVVAASPVLGCLFIGGVNGVGDAFLTQSLRGL